MRVWLESGQAVLGLRKGWACCVNGLVRVEVPVMDCQTTFQDFAHASHLSVVMSWQDAVMGGLEYG